MTALGDLHVLSKDSMYQLETMGDQLGIARRYDIDRYEYYFKDCIASTDDAKIFKACEQA